jgi:exosortase
MASSRLAIDSRRPLTLAFGTTVCLLVGLLLWPVVTHAVQEWSTNEDLGFGFLVPPTIAVLLWWQRSSLRRSSSAGSAIGLPLLVFSLVAYVACQRLAALSPQAVAAGLVLWSVALYLWGWQTARLLVLPLSVLTFSLALQQTLLAPLGFALQEVTAGGAHSFSHVLGLPVMRDGLVLHTQEFAFIVAEACSGMSSLLALLTLAALWNSFIRAAAPARVLLVLSVPLLVVLANTTRVTLVLLVASQFGQDAALGFFHGASSLVLFGLALLGLALVSRILGCRIVDAA